MRLPSALCIAFVVFCMPLVAICAPADFHSPGFGSHITIQGNRVTIRAHDVSLDSFLQELADQTSIVVTTYEPVNDTIGVNFEDMPLEKALKWILRDYNNVFLYAPQKKGEPQITKIIIFSRIKPQSGTSQTLAKTETSKPLTKTSNPMNYQRSQQAAQEDTNYANESKNGALIAQISKDLNKGKREDDKLKAVQNLSNLNDEMAFVPLIQALYDENPKVSQDAMDALSKMGSANVEQALKGFRSDKDPRVRKITEEALKRVGKN